MIAPENECDRPTSLKSRKDSLFQGLLSMSMPVGAFKVKNSASRAFNV